MSALFKLCFCLLALSPLCFGAKLLNHSVYDRDGRFDLLLTFDEPYNGHISQSKQGNFAVVTLNDLTANKNESKEIQNKLVQKFLISPEAKRTNIAFTLDEKAVINISSVNDKMGLRIRILANGANVNPNSTPSVLNSGTTTSAGQANLAAQASSATSPNSASPKLQTKSSSLEGFDFTNYILVLCVLFALLIALWWLKRRVLKAHHFDSKDFRLIFQRPLDKHNQFMILEFENIRYVMIIGSSNLILQKSEIKENTPQEKKDKKQTQEFDSFFEENKQKLQRLVQRNQN